MAIPWGEEYFEAFEADIKRKNDAAVAKMTPTERARYEAMERASQILEAAKVPYVFWACPGDSDNVYWRQNQLVYDVEKQMTFEQRAELAEERAMTYIAPSMCSWIFPDAAWVVGYDADRKIVGLIGPDEEEDIPHE